MFNLEMNMKCEVRYMFLTRIFFLDFEDESFDKSFPRHCASSCHFTGKFCKLHQILFDRISGRRMRMSFDTILVLSSFGSFSFFFFGGGGIIHNLSIF